VSLLLNTAETCCLEATVWVSSICGGVEPPHFLEQSLFSFHFFNYIVATIYSSRFKCTQNTKDFRYTEIRFAILGRQTHRVQYICPWAPFVARRMSPRHSTACSAFPAWPYSGNCAADQCTMFYQITNFWTEFRISSSGIWRRGFLVRRTEVSEEHSAPIFRVRKLWVLLPWMWKCYVPPKRGFLLEPHSVISQKTTFLIVTTVKNYPKRQHSSILHSGRNAWTFP
jgi:hypothetical protein